MRAKPLVLLALTAAVLAAAPGAAHADPLPGWTPPNVCGTFLAVAPAGQSAGCATLGGTPLESGRSYRQITVSVQTGAVHATLQCPLGTPVEFDVAAPFARSAIVPIVSSSNCWITITALFDGTTAVATNTWGFVFS